MKRIFASNASAQDRVTQTILAKPKTQWRKRYRFAPFASNTCATTLNISTGEGERGAPRELCRGGLVHDVA
jgi:hypothetical protein